MRRIVFFAVLLAAAACSQAGRSAAQDDLFKLGKDLLGGAGGALSGEEIADGLREALKVGSERVVAQVGRLDGFNADPAIHIPLPGRLQKVQKALKTVGFSGLADDLETRLNRAAEAAAPEAKALFLQAIGQLTLDDAKRIYDGPDDAATRFFQSKMTAPLSQRMEPIVDRSLAEVGAIKSYDAMIAQYKAIPFVPDVKSDLRGYVVEQALDGIFHYVAEEEAAIRQDPAARTTALLKKVFGGN